MKYPALEGYMIDHNLSLRAFSRKCGICDTGLCRFLRGESGINKITIDKILRATGMTYEECFREGDRLK